MTLRHEASATCLSWIPPTAVEGVFSLPFGLGIAHYDQPPPDEQPDMKALLAADTIRFANQLRGWIEVDDDRGVVTQTRGGRTGAPVPRRVARPPFWRVAAPVAWTTVTLTLHSDGTSAARLAAASPFPRHYLYDSAGKLTRKSALIRYKDWIRGSGHDDPWAGAGAPVPVTAVRGPPSDRWATRYWCPEAIASTPCPRAGC